MDKLKLQFQLNLCELQSRHRRMAAVAVDDVVAVTANHHRGAQ